MEQAELRDRTKQFAKRIINLSKELPDTREARLIGNQVFRSGTSVGANHVAACRGRSRTDFIAKLGIVLEEAEETVYWLELLSECEIVKSERLEPLTVEARELVAIFVATLNTSKNKDTR